MRTNIILNLWKEQCKNRKVFLWGTGKQKDLLISFFNNNQIMIDGIIAPENSSDSKTISSTDFFANYTPNNSFVFITNSKLKEGKIAFLANGFEEGINMLCFGKEYTQNTSIGMHYDIYNNYLYSLTSDISVKTGGSSSIKIGEKCKIGNNVSIRSNSLSEIEIGDNVEIQDGCCIEALNGSKIVISDKTRIEKNSTIQSIDNSNIIIGNNGIIRYNSKLRANISGVVNIGKRVTTQNDFWCFAVNSQFDCGDDTMFSSYIKIMASDAHKIIDLDTNEYYNRKRDITLGSHIWVGAGVTLMPGTLVGDNCVIGANSMLNKSFGTNQLIYGNPASVNRENITWEK